ncbi:MAG: hypothetical protein LBD20_07100 [Spirochaetaceae bacterium]|jgi:hypothetical protein|nr:hypothetical protein [Spirochaetaceae bacterium]
MKRIGVQAFFLTAFLLVFAGCDDWSFLEEDNSNKNDSAAEETGKDPAEQTGKDPAGETGEDPTEGTDEAPAGTILPIPAEPVSINYQQFTDKVTAYSGIGAVDIDWAALDAGSEAAYLNKKNREALIWFNLMRTRPALFANMMFNDDNPDTPGIGISDTNALTDQFPDWKVGTSKALYLAARELVVQFACSDEWDTNKYVKGFTINRFIAEGSVGYFYVFDGRSPEAFIAKLQTAIGKFAQTGFQWHQKAEAGRGPPPAEANMAAVAIEGAVCVIAFGKDIIDKENLPDNIIAGNDEKLYYQYAGDTTLDDIQRNEYSGITWRDIHRIWDTGSFLKNKALEIVGDAADDRQKTERLLRWIIDTYDYDYSSVTDSHNACDILGRLIDHNDRLLVCNEYARIMTAFCRVLGIKARYIEGLAAPTGAYDWRGHAWVQVFFDGKWHMSDPTWNDTGVQSGELIFFPDAANGDDKHLLRF